MSIDEIDYSEEAIELPADPPQQRVAKGQLDDLYIEAFLEKPGSQIDAYKVAVAAAGLNIRIFYQAAHQLHERLREKINTRLIRLSEDDKALGRSIIKDLAQNAKAESVKGAMAQTLAKGLYPDVQITKDMTIDEINQELQQLKEQDMESVH